MAIDIIVGVLILLALIRGWMKGFVFQLGQIAALVVAFALGRALAPALQPTLADAVDVAPQVAETICFFGIFVIVYTVGVLLLRGFTRDIHRESSAFSTGDRALGMVLGGAKGALLVYVLFIALIMANQMTGKLPIPYGSSVTGRWVMQNNFLENEDFPRGKALVKLGWLLHTREPLELVTDPHFVAILSHPKAAPLRTPEVAQALYEGDWLEIIGHEALWDLLDEPEVQEHLNAIEWQDQAPPVAAPTAAPVATPTGAPGAPAAPTPAAEAPIAPDADGGIPFPVPESLRPRTPASP